jgi:hypothetical protein
MNTRTQTVGVVWFCNDCRLKAMRKPFPKKLITMSSLRRNSSCSLQPTTGSYTQQVSNQSQYSPYFSDIHFNIITRFKPRNQPQRSFHMFFGQTLHSSSPPRMLHVQPIPSSHLQIHVSRQRKGKRNASAKSPKSLTCGKAGVIRKKKAQHNYRTPGTWRAVHSSVCHPVNVHRVFWDTPGRFPTQQLI